MVKVLAQAIGIVVHLGNTVTALVIDGQQFGFFGFDLIVDLSDQSGFENRVVLALGWDAGVNGFLHQVTLEEVGVIVLRLVFFIGGFPVVVIGPSRIIGVVKAGLLSVPFGGSAQLGFAAGAQIGDASGELFGIGVKLLDHGGLAAFHVGQLFLLIIRQGNGVQVRIFIALKGFLEVGVGLGLFRGQLGELAFAVAFLLVDGRQLAIELGNFDFLCNRCLEQLACRGHGNAHLIDRHVLDQLEREQANQRQ